MSKTATARLQWKGTDACCDFECSCGTSSHFDGMFMQYVKCSCGQVYECLPNIQLVAISCEPEFTNELDACD